MFSNEASILYFIYVFLASFGLSLYVFHWILIAIALINGKLKLHQPIPDVDPKTCPGVSILKPLCGADENLEVNLESFFQLNYPKYELLFCTASIDDPAVKVVEKLQQKYKDKIPSRLFTDDGCSSILNPKVRNLSQGYNCTQFDLVMICDNNIIANPLQLTDLVTAMSDDTIGMTHQLPFVFDHGDFASTVEKVQFGCQTGRVELYMNALNMHPISGMSTLIRKRILDEQGGIEVIGRHLLEDTLLRYLYLHKGYKIRMGRLLARQNPGSRSVIGFQNRLIRWMQLRYRLMPFLLPLEILQECYTCGLMGALSCYFFFQWHTVPFFLGHCVALAAADYLHLIMFKGDTNPVGKMEYMLGWMFQSCVMYVLIFYGITKPVVNWRGHLFRLDWFGNVYPLTPAPTKPARPQPSRQASSARLSTLTTVAVWPNGAPGSGALKASPVEKAFTPPSPTFVDAGGIKVDIFSNIDKIDHDAELLTCAAIREPAYASSFRH